MKKCKKLVRFDPTFFTKKMPETCLHTTLKSEKVGSPTVGALVFAQSHLPHSIIHHLSTRTGATRSGRGHLSTQIGATRSGRRHLSTRMGATRSGRRHLSTQMGATRSERRHLSTQIGLFPPSDSWPIIANSAFSLSFMHNS